MQSSKLIESLSFPKHFQIRLPLLCDRYPINPPPIVAMVSLRSVTNNRSFFSDKSFKMQMSVNLGHKKVKRDGNMTKEVNKF